MARASSATSSEEDSEGSSDSDFSYSGDRDDDNIVQKHRNLRSANVAAVAAAPAVAVGPGNGAAGQAQGGVDEVAGMPNGEALAALHDLQDLIGDDQGAAHEDMMANIGVAEVEAQQAQAAIPAVQLIPASISKMFGEAGLAEASKKCVYGAASNTIRVMHGGAARLWARVNQPLLQYIAENPSDTAAWLMWSHSRLDSLSSRERPPDPAAKKWKTIIN